MTPATGQILFFLLDRNWTRSCHSVTSQLPGIQNLHDIPRNFLFLSFFNRLTWFNIYRLKVPDSAYFCIGYMLEIFCIKIKGNFVNNYRWQYRPRVLFTYFMLLLYTKHDWRKNSNCNLPAAAIETNLYKRQQKLIQQGSLTATVILSPIKINIFV